MLTLFIVICPSICLSICPSTNNNNNNVIYAPMDDDRPCFVTNPNCSLVFNGQTPLLSAIQHNQLKIVKVRKGLFVKYTVIFYTE